MASISYLVTGGAFQNQYKEDIAEEARTPETVICNGKEEVVVGRVEADEKS